MEIIEEMGNKTQKYIDVYTFTFMKPNGEEKSGEVQAYNPMEAREKVNKRHPDQRLTALYVSDRAVIKNHGKNGKHINKFHGK